MDVGLGAGGTSVQGSTHDKHVQFKLTGASGQGGINVLGVLEI